MVTELWTYISSYISPPRYHITNIIGKPQDCKIHLCPSVEGTTGCYVRHNRVQILLFRNPLCGTLTMTAVKIVQGFLRPASTIFMRPFFICPASDPAVRSLRLWVFLFATFFFPGGFRSFLAVDTFLSIDPITPVLSNLGFSDPVISSCLLYCESINTAIWPRRLGIGGRMACEIGNIYFGDI
jgi:hypothetical protein